MAFISSYTVIGEVHEGGLRDVRFIYISPDGSEHRHGPMQLPQDYDVDALRIAIQPALEEMLAAAELRANYEEIVE